MSDFISIAKVNDFRAGKIRRYFVDGKEIGVVSWNQRFYAFSNRCTHSDFQLHFGFIEDDKICCPIHYAEFEIATGQVAAGPMFIEDLPVYPVRIEGEDVQISLGA
jgi:nitrite reductase/ring-hydroxylating ferredoxin subunit